MFFTNLNLFLIFCGTPIFQSCGLTDTTFRSSQLFIHWNWFDPALLTTFTDVTDYPSSSCLISLQA
ncbi:MAG: hypothetical protein ACTSRB_09210 [Candidatus Helarchaeota archaeon]